MPDDLVSVRYIVTDVEGAVDFYTRHFGFTLRSSAAPAFADVVRGRLRLLLSGPASSAGRPMPDGRIPEPGGWNRIHLIVADIAGEVERLRAAGLVFRNDIVRGPGGQQIRLATRSSFFNPPLLRQRLRLRLQARERREGCWIEAEAAAIAAEETSPMRVPLAGVPRNRARLHELSRPRSRPHGCSSTAPRCTPGRSVGSRRGTRRLDCGLPRRCLTACEQPFGLRAGRRPVATARPPGTRSGSRTSSTRCRRASARSPARGSRRRPRRRCR
ncbi:MAG: hypothetical protein QOI48_3040 [Solirubrobacteraceae bacterium]|nr:hypothetical protein [Solirubrobacteraceae bacterium]